MLAAFGGGANRSRDRIQGLAEIIDDVLDVFESDAQTYRLSGDACSALFLGCHLSMGR